MINSDGNINFKPYVQVVFEKKTDRLEKKQNFIGLDNLIKISFTSNFENFTEYELIEFIGVSIKLHYLEYSPDRVSYMKHLGSILHYNFFKSLTELWIFDRYGNIIEKRETMPYIGSKQRKKTNPSSQFDNIKLVQN